VSVVLVVWHEKIMRRIVLSSEACLTLPYLATLFYERQDFGQNLLNVKWVILFSLQVCLKHFSF